MRGPLGHWICGSPSFQVRASATSVVGQSLNSSPKFPMNSSSSRADLLAIQNSLIPSHSHIFLLWVYGEYVRLVAHITWCLLPVVPARGGAEVALKIYIRPFSSIELACAVRQPSACVRALCESGVLFPMSHLKLHFALHTSHCTLHTPHCTLHTSHFTLHTSHFTLHSSQSTLHTSLHASHCTLHTSHSTLHTSHSTLHTALFTPHTSHCTLHTPHFISSELFSPYPSSSLLISSHMSPKLS